MIDALTQPASGSASDVGARVLRVLLAHGDGGSRRSIGRSLKRVAAGPVAVYEAPSLPAALRAVERLDPHVVLLDLSEDRELALEVAREARRPGRLVVGLYSPLALPER